jgi:hypothetical protein
MIFVIPLNAVVECVKLTTILFRRIHAPKTP